MKIELSHVSKYYRDGEKSTRGLEDVSLSFETDSSFVVITGESGAGKSTLFRVLTGTEDFDEGEICFDGKPLSGVSDEEKARLYRENIAFDFQEYNLIEGFSPVENIVLALTKAGYGLKEAKKKANDVLEEVGLHKQKKMKVAKLSGGERQRVAIARCLASDAKILLFDEPTGNLDPNTSKEIIALIESLQKGRLILYITHDFDLVRDKATRHIVLADGKVLSDETISLPQEENVKEIKQEKHPTPLKSNLYNASLFAFKRPGRLFFTFLILFFSAAYLYFGASALASYNDLASDISTFGTTVQSGHGLGNEVRALRESGDGELLESSDDYYYDPLDLGEDFACFISQGEDIDSSFSSLLDANSGIYYITPFLIEDSLITSTVYTAQKPVEGALPFTVYLPSSEGSVRGYSYQDVLTHPKKGKNFYLLPQILVSNFFENANLSYSGFYTATFDMTDLNDYAQAYRTKIEEVSQHIYIDKILAYDCKLSDGDKIYGCFSDEEERKNYWDICQNLIAYSVTQYEQQSGYSSPYNLGYLSTLNQTLFASEFDLKEGDKTFRYNNSLAPLGEDKKSIFTSDTKLVLSSSFQDKLSSLTLTYNGASFSLASIDSSYLSFTREAENAYSYYVSYYTLYKIARSINAYGRYYAKNSAEANQLVRDLTNKNASLRVLYAKQEESHVINHRSSSVIFDIFVRIGNLFSVISSLAGFILILFLARTLLSRFYYRKGSDEKVLSDIGFTPRDMYLTNALQFCFVMAICVLITHLAFPLGIPELGAIYAKNVPLFILAILLSLAVSFYVSLPTKKHKRRERHHD